MQISRWRNILILRSSLVPPSLVAIHTASFHSTPNSSEKWKNKWNFVTDTKREQEPSKNFIRYATRQKRADAKKALKGLLYNSGSSKFSNKWSLGEKGSWPAEQDHPSGFDKKGRPKSSTRFAGKSHQKKMKRNFRRESFSEDFDDYPKTMFEATFGNRCYTWSFDCRHESFQNSTFGFEWREHCNRKSSRAKEWDTASGSESDEEPSIVGSCSDRTVLGLPASGPLKIEDVKKAFHSSALLWHPDKHQGPSQIFFAVVALLYLKYRLSKMTQGMAEEKFKVCVNAYKSLCSALSSAR